MIKKILENLKPIEYDIHFKYQCKCGELHWLSLDEASEPDFIIVCECKKRIKVKPINRVVIKYKKQKFATLNFSEEKKDSESNHTDTIVTQKEEQITETKNVCNEEKLINNELPNELLNTCSNLLVSFGYSKREAIDIIKKFYDDNPSIKYSIFVKQLLASLGRKNENC